MKYRPRFARNEFAHPAKHLWFKGIDRGIVYPLIQKNGCSAFKNFLNSRTHHRQTVRRTIDALLFKKRPERPVWPYWQVSISPDVIDQNDFIFVYRDPADRLVSAFKNKFIDDSGNKKILGNFQTIMRLSPEDACFNDFIEYASHAFKDIDSHVWPQKAQLLSLPYHPIKLTELTREMSKIIGSELAKAYFQKPSNQSAQLLKSLDSRADTLPVGVLRDAKAEGLGVTTTELLSSANIDRIREIYWQDYEMIEKHVEGETSACT